MAPTFMSGIMKLHSITPQYTGFSHNLYVILAKAWCVF